MQTFLHKLLRDTPEGKEADRILRSCVHCGFCNATCPTYQLLGDERDGPRGRIYLIKEMLEQNTATRETREHLDRCLICRSCETTCPSGVEYHRLLEIGRSHLETLVERDFPDRMQRRALLETVPETARLEPLLKLGRLARPLLPGTLKAKLPAAASAPAWPEPAHERQIILLEGCVQSLSHPVINSAAARVLDRLGVSALPGAGCCGALAQHLPAMERARETARRNVDAWWPMIENGAEAVLLTATGCAPTVMDYGRLLADDDAYAERAARLASMAMDISSFLEREDPDGLRPPVQPSAPIAFHAPCSLQHGLKRSGAVERLLQNLGFELTPVADAHLCCGSAGAYSVLQADIAGRLRAKKLESLEAGNPSLIATANIGCLQHLQAGTGLEVKHWIELLA